MNTQKSFILLVSALSMNIAAAQQESQGITQEEYRASIASFGVSQEESEAASKKAVEIASELREQDQNDPIDSLPDNWLEDTPY